MLVLDYVYMKIESNYFSTLKQINYVISDRMVTT